MKGRKNLTIKDFTLEITELPNEKIGGLELEKFFQGIVDHHQLGAVTNVTLAYKFKDSLENLLRVCEYRLGIKRYEKKISYGTISKGKKEGYERKIRVLKTKAVLENNLAKEKLGLKKEEYIDYQNMADKKVLKAFISFEDTETATKLGDILNNVGFNRRIIRTN